MGTITPDLSGIVDGTTADASDFTTPLNTITNEINGNLDNDNVIAGAGIDQSKLTGTTLGYAEINSPFTTTTVGSWVDITGLSLTVTVPAGGRRVKLTACMTYISSSGQTQQLYASIREDTAIMAETIVTQTTASYRLPLNLVGTSVASAGSHTYKVSFQQDSAGTLTCGVVGATAFILVELI